MANKRIKDLTGTATSAAADDYVALDGATNKTRKGLLLTLLSSWWDTVTSADARTFNAAEDFGAMAALLPVVPSSRKLNGVDLSADRSLADLGAAFPTILLPSGLNIVGDIPDSWASSSSADTVLIFGNSVTTIGSYAFYSCYGLTSLTIPNSVTTIGDYAFYNCYGLTSLTIPNSVTSIGDYAFRYCSGFLGSLTIPDSVTTIGDYAFYGCYGLTSLTIPNSVTSIGSSAFQGCYGFTGSLTIPNSVTSIGANAFDGCTGFTGSLTIPDSVTSIGSYAFQGCTLITNVDCRVTRTIMDGDATCLLASGVLTLHALVADSSWTVGADTIGGKLLTVIKDLT